MMFHEGEQKSESGKVMVAENKFDDELEEGEIVDTDDDEEVQVVEQKTEQEHYEQNHLCVYKKHSVEMKHGRRGDLSCSQANARISRYDNMPHTEESSYYAGMKRNACYLTDDEDWSEDETANYKRLRSEKTAEKCSVLRNEHGRESYKGSYHGVKRDLGYMLDDDDWSVNGMARQKRRRLNTTDDKYSVIRNGRFDQRETGNDGYDDGYSRRETIYNAYVEPVTFQREFENKRGVDFQSPRYDCYYRNSNDDAENNHESNNGRAMPSKTRRSDVEQDRKIPKITKLCKYYRTNRQCYNQDRCMYMHEEFPCKFHHTGMRCYSGDECRYSHAEIDDNQKKLLLKNVFEKRSKPFVRNNRNFYNDNIPSLLNMQLPVPVSLKVTETYNGNATTISTLQDEPIMVHQLYDNSVSTEEDFAAQTVCTHALSDDYEQSSDDDEDYNLVIDEDR